MKAIELFAGGGGLAIGTAAAGFEHEVLVERDSHSCSVLRMNVERKTWPYEKWKVIQDDISKHTFQQLAGKIDLVAGGPPCQPFSIGGKHRAHQDVRDMFPQVARVISEVQPRAFIFENVRGLTRETFKNYFEYILLRLSFPEEAISKRETWIDHLSRLERIRSKNSYSGLQYIVLAQVLNAADFGIPQNRHRVFIVGFRSDTHQEWNFPLPTHSEEALFYSKWVNGEYWDHHGISIRRRPRISASEAKKLSSPRYQGLFGASARWATVRDAICDLPSPNSDSARGFQGHRFQPGARPYPGHTGSVLDLPAKTLKAGDHGVPGGENMLALPDGQFRYFTIRESARLQTFPDDYVFPTSWTESMRQIGNAVPVRLAEIVANSVRRALLSKKVARST